MGTFLGSPDIQGVSLGYGEITIIDVNVRVAGVYGHRTVLVFPPRVEFTYNTVPAPTLTYVHSISKMSFQPNPSYYPSVRPFNFQPFNIVSLMCQNIGVKVDGRN